MTPTVFDLVGKRSLRKGLPWSFRFTRYAGRSRVPVDLSGCAARLEIIDALAAGSAPLIALTSDAGGIVLGAAAGTVWARLDREVSASWSVTSLRYRLFFTDSLGFEDLYLYGRLGWIEDDA